MDLVRRVTEGLARKTSRRGLFGRGAELATGAMLGVAAGSLTRPGAASAGVGTVCQFPGPFCGCDGCISNGLCGKPCNIMTQYYASGCWVTSGVTCCDCDCNGFQGREICGCGSDIYGDQCP